jgi:hypothetical protein
MGDAGLFKLLFQSGKITVLFDGLPRRNDDQRSASRQVLFMQLILGAFSKQNARRHVIIETHGIILSFIHSFIHSLVSL